MFSEGRAWEVVAFGHMWRPACEASAGLARRETAEVVEEGEEARGLEHQSEGFRDNRRSPLVLEPCSGHIFPSK